MYVVAHCSIYMCVTMISDAAYIELDMLSGSKLRPPFTYMKTITNMRLKHNLRIWWGQNDAFRRHFDEWNLHTNENV